MRKSQQQSHPAAPRRYWTIPQLELELGVRRAALYEEVRAGRLPAFRIGRRLLVRADAFAAFIGADDSPRQSA
jgi:excisionase family DNA binding protein